MGQGWVRDGYRNPKRTQFSPEFSFARVLRLLPSRLSAKDSCQWPFCPPYPDESRLGPTPALMQAPAPARPHMLAN
jgi:hypothetical protein